MDGDNDEKLEFASAAWVAEIRKMIDEGVADEDLSGIDYSQCEVFTDPPAHLRRGESERLAWYLRIGNGDVEVGEGELEDASFKMIGDYQTVLPLARAMSADMEPLVAEAMASGKIRSEGSRDAAPPILAKLDLHDRMAVLTA